MCCAYGMTSEAAPPFNALPEDWASDPTLIAGLTVDDEDEHDDPVLLWHGQPVETWREDYPYPEKMTRAEYEYLKRPLQVELVKLQNWVKSTGQRIVIIFEGRDAAGKGGTIKRVTQYLNPRVAQIAALPKPTEREAGEWYFQRYIAHLPSSGEMTLFDRSWYNRAGVEHVMGFCTKQEYARFMHQCPAFERMLVEDGILLRKYWFSVSDTEQQARFESRLDDPVRRWKLSPMDLQSITRWEDYSRAKDDMFTMTDTVEAPWYVVESDVKRRARINMIAHLLSTIPYRDVPEPKLKLPRRPASTGYVRTPLDMQTFVPDHAATLLYPADGLRIRCLR